MKKIITLILSISMMFAFDINSPENQEKIEYYRNILSENDFNKLISSMNSENLKAEKTEYNKKIQEIKNKQKQARRNNQNTNSSSNRDQFVEFQLDLYDSYGDTWNGSTTIDLNSGDFHVEIHIDWNMGSPYLDIYTSEGWTPVDQCYGDQTHQECTIFLPAAIGSSENMDIHSDIYPNPIINKNRCIEYISSRYEIFVSTNIKLFSYVSHYTISHNYHLCFFNYF